MNIFFIIKNLYCFIQVCGKQSTNVQKFLKIEVEILGNGNTWWTLLFQDHSIFFRIHEKLNYGFIGIDFSVE